MSEQKGLVLDFTGVVCVWGGPIPRPHPTEACKGSQGFEGCMTMSFLSSLKVPWDDEWRN